MQVLEEVYEHHCGHSECQHRWQSAAVQVVQLGHQNTFDSVLAKITVICSLAEQIEETSNYLNYCAGSLFSTLLLSLKFNTTNKKQTHNVTHISHWYSDLCDETTHLDYRYQRVMVVVKDKALPKISSFVLLVLFLPSNFELDWKMEAKWGKKREDNCSSIPIPLTSK